jgi:hypothetical protein
MGLVRVRVGMCVRVCLWYGARNTSLTSPTYAKPHPHFKPPSINQPHTPPSHPTATNPQQASGVAQLIPALKPTLISMVVGLLVPHDGFSRPYVDIIMEGARP